MKNLILILLFSFCFGNTSIAQTSDNQHIENAQEKADMMVKAFKNKDYSTFLDLTHPKVVELAGGKEKMLKILNEGLGPGIEVLEVEIYNPSTLIRKDGTLQCSFKQKQFMKIGDQKIYTIGSLIGISYDKGAYWSFIGVASNTLATIQASFPELSDELDVQPQSNPTFIDN